MGGPALAERNLVHTSSPPDIPFLTHQLIPHSANQAPSGEVVVVYPGDKLLQTISYCVQNTEIMVTLTSLVLDRPAPAGYIPVETTMKQHRHNGHTPPSEAPLEQVVENAAAPEQNVENEEPTAQTESAAKRTTDHKVTGLLSVGFYGLANGTKLAYQQTRPAVQFG